MSKNTDLGNLVNGLFVSSTKNVGIGTTSPLYTLQVSAATGTNVIPQINAVNTTTNGYGILRLTGASRGGIIDFYDTTAAQASIVGQGGALGFYTNGNSSGTPKVTITSAGNVGIGTSSPGVAGGAFTGLDIRGSGGGSLVFGSTSTVFSYIYANSSALFLDTTGTLPISFNAGGTEKMRINNSGVVSIGNTNNGAYRLDVTGEIITRGANVSAYSYEDRLTTSTTYTLYAYNGLTFFYNAGNRAQINMTSGAYTALSDINKKKNFEQSNIGLNEVMQLKPTLYNFKTDNDLSPKELGFIAQEVKELIPQAYVESEDGKDTFIGLNQMPIIAALTKAIQELSAEVQLLKNK